MQCFGKFQNILDLKGSHWKWKRTYHDGEDAGDNGRKRCGCLRRLSSRWDSWLWRGSFYQCPVFVLERCESTSVDFWSWDGEALNQPESSTTLLFRPYHFVVLGHIWGFWCSASTHWCTQSSNFNYNKQCLSLCGGPFRPSMHALFLWYIKGYFSRVIL